MVIKAILSKVKDNLISGPDNIFKTIFQPLKKRHPELFEESVRYCATGEPVAVLLRAKQTVLQNVQEAFGAIGSLQGYWYHKETDSIKARADIYTRLRDGRLPLETVVRMGRLFGEMIHPNISKHTHDDLPDWLYILLADWLYWTGETRMGGRNKRVKAPPPTLNILSDLCRLDNLPEFLWLLFYLDRRGSAYAYYGMDAYWEAFRRAEGVGAYIVSHKDGIIKDIVPKLSSSGMVQLLTEINELNLVGDFADFIVEQAVSTSKQIRNQAAHLTPQLPAEFVKNRLSAFLFDGKTAQRKTAAELIGRSMGDEGQALLTRALEKESVKSVKSVIEVALAATAVQMEAAEEEALDIPDYALPDLQTQVPDHYAQTIRDHIAKKKEGVKDLDTENVWQKRHKAEVMALSRADADQMVRIMNGKARLKEGWHTIALFMDEPSLFKDPSLDLIHIMRLHGDAEAGRQWRYRGLHPGPLQLWMRQQPGKLTDLRALADALTHLGWPDDQLIVEILRSDWRQSFLVKDLPPEAVWPYFAERLDPILSALMGKENTTNRRDTVSMDRVMEILDLFPRLPAQTRAPLLQLALGEGKTYRGRCQELLAPVPGIAQQVVAALKSNAQEARINAARWLGRLGQPEAVPPLKAALAKESREAVRAVIISALESLGEDISELLRPEVLLKEATKGLKKKMPKGLEWFPFDTLPALAWSDASAVDPAIPRWWVVLACKLKDPGANQLVLKYLQRLDPASRGRLGLLVLRAFIAQDTIGPTQQEAEQKAQQGAAARYQQWQYWIKHGWADGFKDKTVDDAHAEILREVLGTYLGTAIKEKGILSLCAHTPGHEAVPILQAYMKTHYKRRHQIEAMLQALAPGDDPHVIQLLLAVARRYRTRSVQQTAADLVKAVADRNNWTAEQLADRTMPTAGFDIDGSQILDYGTRRFTLKLDDQLKPVLFNEKGKTIKSLPAARQADDAEQVKEAKAGFSTAKKELKQVVQLTTGRFYEAMCAQRRWPVAEWQQYLYDHPIANRLIQRLIWQCESDDGDFSFRPSEDGALIDADDDTHELPDGGTVRLLHRSMITDDQADAWRRHLKDYAVKPLFEQINRPVPSQEMDADKRQLDTYVGYVSDTFTLRGTLTKLGYQRGTPEDGGFFYYYFKDFISLNLRAIIFFSGNCVPEENVPAALEKLGFFPIDHDAWLDENKMIALSEVPPVLLSEVTADYRFAADKTGGFDPDWKKKMPW